MSSYWYPAYIGLGSNLENPVQQLQQALYALQQNKTIHVVSQSGFYQTEPYGEVEQEDFINAVVGVLTTLSAEDLLHTLLELENAQGRKRIEHWGPRTLDLDLLVYSDQTSDNDFLRLPHPEISKRLFVLRPFADIAEDVLVPNIGRVSELLSKVHKTDIKKVEF